MRNLGLLAQVLGSQDPASALDRFWWPGRGLLPAGPLGWAVGAGQPSVPEQEDV